MLSLNFLCSLCYPSATITEVLGLYVCITKPGYPGLLKFLTFWTLNRAGLGSGVISQEALEFRALNHLKILRSLGNYFLLGCKNLADGVRGIDYSTSCVRSCDKAQCTWLYTSYPHNFAYEVLRQCNKQILFIMGTSEGTRLLPRPPPPMGYFSLFLWRWYRGRQNCWQQDMVF